MLIGPVFSREAITAPRRARHFVARGGYVAALLMLVSTAWLVLSGTQVIRNVGDLARFGSILFQILAPLQLALAVLFSALLTASSVSQEKDRRTLILLLMTDLKSHELVLGKLLSSMLSVLVLLSAALPMFMGLVLLGGVGLAQVGRIFAVTFAAAFAAGSLGSTLALWREKTFQTLALTALVIVFYLALCEGLSRFAGTSTILGLTGEQIATAASPWRAVFEATRPLIQSSTAAGAEHDPVLAFLCVALGLAAALNLVAIARVRVWNPSREVHGGRRDPREEDDDEPAAVRAAANVSTLPGRAAGRDVWANPIAWREIRTWAYGRKVLAIRLVYVALAAAAAAALWKMDRPTRDSGALVLLPLFLVSLVLINAQAVTALSTERDGKTLDLLLVTDLTPKEFIFGKLGGVLFNTKEMVLLPALVCLGLWCRGSLSAENAFYVVAGLLVMDLFVAVLGIHCGLTHENSRIAVGTSLGTVLFLFIGVAVLMRIMVAFGGSSDSFTYQLPAFLALILGGGVGLYGSLGARNASRAIFYAAFTCPFLTFWAITSFLQDYTAGVFLVMAATYGFATAAMLIPAISAFDVASGQTMSGE